MIWFDFLPIFAVVQLVNGLPTQSHTCAFYDETTGYSITWSAGVGFVDFFFDYKHFPTRTAHWTGVGFGEQSLQLALIESQYDRVTISSAAMYGSQPPLKLPKANMVTRGYGSIDEDRLEASFSVPIYYFKDCETWTFFTMPTQVGQPYTGTPKVKTVCNVTNFCIAPKIPHSLKAYPDQTNNPSLNIQLPNEVTKFLDQPIDADIDIKGGLHLTPSQNGVNVRYSPQSSTYNNFQNQQSPYDQQYGFSGNQQAQFGVNGFNNPQQSQFPNNFNQNPYYNSNGYFNNNGNAPNTRGFYDTRNPNANQFNASAFTVENPNYKYLPDGLGIQYEANTGRQRFYDNNGNPNQFGTATDDPIRSNADQNKLNYQEISTQSANNPQRSQQFTNNIYGYDYRSNPGSKYTINGNEQQYQPPENQRFPTGRRKKRQSLFKGTAYENQDSKFPRVENTIPMSNNFDDSTNNFNTDTFTNPQRVFYDSQNSQNQQPLYYPYRTETFNNMNRQQGNFGNTGTFTGNNQQFDSSSSVGPLAPYYINPNSQSNSNNGRQFDPNPFSTNRYNPASPFYNQTQPNLNGNGGEQNFNDNTRFNPANHPDTRQYDGIFN